MFEADSLSGWATAYAAVVATLALGLELRRWFESGVKLNVGYGTDMLMVTHEISKKQYLTITVANRGDTPTTLTNLGFQVHPTVWSRIRRKATKSFIANNPSPAQPLPYLLEPGARWMGLCLQNEEIAPLLDEGHLWAEVYATHADRPTRVRVKRRGKPMGKKIEGASA